METSAMQCHRFAAGDPSQWIPGDANPVIHTGLPRPRFPGLRLQNLPNLQPEYAILSDQLEVVPVGSDQPRAVCPPRQRDQHVEVEIAGLVWLEAPVPLNSHENLAGFEPVLLRGRQNWKARLKIAEQSLSAAVVAPRESSASTTVEVRTRSSTPAMRWV